MDAAYLYRELADVEKDPNRQTYSHAWPRSKTSTSSMAGPLRGQQRAVPDHPISRKTQLMAWPTAGSDPSPSSSGAPGRGGPRGPGVPEARQGRRRGRTRHAAETIATESAEHARELAGILGHGAEPWHSRRPADTSAASSTASTTA